MIAFVLLAALPNLSAQEATQPVETTPPVEVTQEPTQATSAEPEVTQAPVEATATTPAPVETTPETTAEVPVEATPEVTQNPTTEPTPIELVDSVTEDFEAFDASAWTLTNWQTITGAENTYLGTVVGGSSAILNTFIESDIQLTARIRATQGNLAEIAFRASFEEYRALFASNGSVALYRGNSLLSSYSAPEDAATNTWLTVTITAVGNTIGISVNGTPRIAYTDPTPLGAGNIIVRSGVNNTGEVAIDDLFVTVIDPETAIPPVVETPAPEVTASPSPEGTSEPTAEATSELTPEITPEATSEINPEITPEATSDVLPEITPEVTSEVTPEVTPELTPEVTEEAGANGLYSSAESKLQVRLLNALNDYAAGNIETAQENLLLSGYSLDAENRVLVEIRLADGVQSDAVAALLTEYGSAIYAQTSGMIEAAVTFEALIEAANRNDVTYIRSMQTGVSTGSTNAEAAAPGGSVFSEGFNRLGVDDWHDAGFRGSGVTIGVIDTGFNGALNADHNACLREIIGNPPYGAGDHGLNVIEVLCDIAPNSQVYAFPTLSYASLTESLRRARSIGIDVLVITMDLGAAASPGDGTGREDGDDPYLELQQAREEGMIIFAAGGNSGIADPSSAGATRLSRYAAFNVGLGTDPVTVSIRATVNDRIYISWNDWNGLGSSTEENLEDFNIELGLAGGTPFSSYPDGPPEDPFFRDTLSDAPGTFLDVIGIEPDGCSVADGICDLDLTITRAKGDSTVLMQVQVVPRELTSQGEVQTQDVEITGITGATFQTNVGTLARPADSPDVIAVASVCAYEDNGYTLLPDSSVGPVYGFDGSLPGGLSSPPLRDEVKPDITSVSYVETSISSLNNPSNCDGTVANMDTIGGFGGTSAAAAHAAGIAALSRSASSFAPFFDGGTEDAVQAQQDYMQARAVDLPLTAPNSFDTTYGAGLSYLGTPNYNLLNTQNGLQPADFFPETDSCTGNIVYVGQGNIGGAQNGTFAAPYSQLGYAVEEAGVNGCVVLMPGEYITPLYVNESGLGLYAYDLVTGNTFPETLIRVVGQFDNGTYTAGAGSVVTTFPNMGGFYFDGTANNVVAGFRFVGSSVYDDDTAVRHGITSDGSSNLTISDNTFTGWTTVIGSPVQILGGSAVNILDNNFRGNTGGLIGTTFYSPSVTIADAGGSAEGQRVLLQENVFEDNTSTELVGGASIWPSILFSQGSYIDLVGNAFVGNSSGSVVAALTDNAADASEVRIVSNLFLNNDSTVNNAPLVHAYYAARLSFMNNTVVRNDLLGNGALIARGDRGAGSGGSIAGTTQRFDFFNNLVFNNTFDDLFVDTNNASVNTCQNLAGTEDATQFNWWDNSGTIGACAGEMAANSNLVDAADDPGDDFIGHVNTSLNANEDIVYYSLRQFDEALEIYSQGIDYSNITAGSDVDLTQPPFTRGILGQLRLVDVANWEQNDNTDTSSFNVDIGAFEYNRLDIVIDIYSHKTTTTDTGLPTDPLPDYPEDSSQIVINLDDVVQGGFGDLTFTLLTSPDTFGTHCGPSYGTGNKGAFITQSTGGVRLFYCPPRDFYTEINSDEDPLPPVPAEIDPDGDGFPGTGLDKGTGIYDYCEDEADFVADPYSCTLGSGVVSWPDYQIFTYTVIDEAGVSDTGALLLRIDPTDDPALVAVIGDGSPAEDIYRVTGNIGTTINVRLRPFVQFDNFSFSEGNNPEFGTIGSYQIDYPFNFTNITQQNDLDNVVESIDTSNLDSTGQIGITLSADSIGEETITYQVTDADGNSVTNTLKVISVSRIPTSAGIYDDSSFAFDYSNAAGDGPGDWEAENNANSINNTLHTSSGEGDVANFGLSGTGFVLYMQQSGRGGFWDLEINGETVTGWALAPDSTTVYRSAATADGFTCTTTSIASDLGTLTLFNRGRDAYTVSCDSTTDSVHVVNIINTQGRTLSVDAFSIMDILISPETGPLGPGFHDVNEDEVRAIFQGVSGWQEISSRLYSNNLAYVYTDATTPSDPLRFTVQGGTGFALGTQLNINTATYTICVTDMGVDGDVDPTDRATCQSLTNSPELRTRRATDTFRPFYGLNPNNTYQVDILNITPTENGEFVFDSIVVFDPTDMPTEQVNGTVNADDIGHFVVGGGLDDSWRLNTLSRSAFGSTLYELERRVTAAGPYIGFEVTGGIDTIYYTYEDRRPSDQMLICVDRADGVITNDGDLSDDLATAHGNCIQVNLNDGSMQQVLADGTLDPTINNILLTDGTIIISEGDFRTGWSGSEHTVEIFSLVNTSFTLDRLVAAGSGVPLPAGSYEEYVSNLEFFIYDPVTETTSAATTEVTDSRRTTDYTADFTRIFGRAAFRDSGSGVIYTTVPNATIRFEIDGTGFAPIVRTERYGGAIEACWLAGDQTAAATITNGTCQEFDTEERRTTYGAVLPVLGLPDGAYTITVRFLGDDFEPSALLRTPVLWFDGVRVYDDDLTQLVSLQNGVTAEGNYEKRLEDNTFAYFGSNWQTETSNRARNSSGGNYDEIRRGELGATVAFRVSSANVVTLIRSLSRAYAPWLVCAIEEGSATERSCFALSNEGRGDQNELSFYLSDDLSAGNYIVTLTALDSGTINFDAVTPNAVTSALTAGKYDDGNPAIAYRYDADNLVPNGDMDTQNGDITYWSAVGSPVTNTQSSRSYAPRWGWQITTSSGGGDGMSSLPFAVQADTAYTVIARVFIDTTTPGTVTMSMPGVSEFTDQTTSLAANQWVTLRDDFFIPSGSASDDALRSIQFTGTGDMTFYVDDVQVVQSSGWIAEDDRFAYGGFQHVSTSHGAEAAFSFTGTGFGIGTNYSRIGGEMQVCWLDYVGTIPGNNEVLSSGDCITYQNESIRNQYNVSRVVYGLDAANTYRVVVRDVEDGETVLGRNVGDARNWRYALGTLVIDYVEIFDETPPQLTGAGSFNEDALIGIEPILLRLPEARWGISSNRNYTQETATTIVDDRGRVDRSASGPVAALNLVIPANEDATVIFDTYSPNRRASSQLLVCAGGVEGIVTYDGDYSIENTQNCALLDTLQNNRFITLSSSLLPELSNTGGSDKEVILTLQTLEPGEFLIDGFQVLYATALAPGFYEENLGEGVLSFGGSVWELENNRRYSGGAALKNSDTNGTMDFTFTGTGISIVTAFNTRFGGEITVNVTNGSTIDETEIVDTAQSNGYGTAVTIAGLPQDTYDVSITTANDLNESVVLDAIEVYGTLQTLGSLYDDAENTLSGVPYITYGPGTATWQLLTGRVTRNALNETLHVAGTVGAVASFEIQNAYGIGLFYNNLRTRAGTVEVCFRDTGTLTETCEDVTLNTSGRNTVAAPSQSKYFVSIIGAENNDFAFDAVQVLESDPANGPYYEGIYGADYFVDFPGSYTLAGNAALTTSNEINLPGNGDSVEFDISGVAFSLVVRGTSGAYNVCVTDTTDCDVIDDDLPLAGESASLNAITYVGLHDGSGAARTLTVRLTNTDSASLLVQEIHVLGDDDALIIGDTDRHENDDLEARYLPFGSLVSEDSKRGSQYSDGTQHTGNSQGSMVYLEISDLGSGGTTGFSYVRELSVRYGSVEICYGAIGTDTLSDARAGAQCVEIDNNTTNAAQVETSIEPAANFCDNDCWVSIRNLDGRVATFDYLRLFDTSAPLVEGFYQDNYGGLTFSDPEGTSTLGWQSIEDNRALGGSAMQIIADATELTSSNGATVDFIMQGTGFTIFVTGDRDTDAVRVCYATSTGGETAADALAGTCQTFDTETRRTTNGMPLTIAGLPDDQYVVAAQMLPDNYDPSPHSTRDLPLGMSVEGVQVYGTMADDWQNLIALQPGIRYETSYVDRETENTFLYYGSDWSTVDNARARRNSNGDYDQARAYGSGIVFRVTNADALTLYTNLGRRSTTVRLCAAPEGTPEDTRCQDIPLDTSNETQVPISFRFEDFGVAAASNYVVTAFALNDNEFVVDAVEVTNTVTLTEGTYEATDPSLFYDGQYENLIVNGSMEADDDWRTLGNPEVSTQGRQRYEGRYGWQIEGDIGEGIASETFLLTETDVIYTAIARVRVQNGRARLKIVETGSGAFTIASTSIETADNTWVTLRIDFTLTSIPAEGLAAELQVVSDATNSILYVDDVSLNVGGNWQGDYNRRYTDGSAWRSTTHGASMEFTFQGTGFSIASFIDRDGGEMEICYVDAATYAGTGYDDASCLIYQQEDNRLTDNAPRTIVGLPDDTYYVRVRDVEDGYTVTRRRRPDFPRLSRYPVGSIAIDYVRIYDEPTPPVVEAGYYNEDATDASGTSYLDLYPSDRWATFEGRQARGYTQESYLGVIDERGRTDIRSAGQTAVLYADVPAEGTTVLLYTGNTSNRNSQQLLACAGDGMSGEITWDGEVYSLSNSDNCVLFDLRETAVAAINTDDFGLGTGITRFQFTTLGPGGFTIDAYQVINGTTLASGIYDDPLPDTLLDFNTSESAEPDRTTPRCDESLYWCEQKAARGYGGTVLSTRSADASLEFDITGTGFSIITNPNVFGVDTLICYQQTPIAGEPNFPATSQVLDSSGNVIWDNNNQDISLGGTWCDVVTTDTQEWESRNPYRPRPRRGDQYGFAYYGLPMGNYSVLVRMIDQDAVNSPRDGLEIDGVVVFSDYSTLPVIAEGFYDDTDAPVSYEPLVFWTESDSRNGPPRGAYGQSEHEAANAGSVAQMQVNGNAVTLFYTTDGRNSGNVQVCLLVTGATIHCTPEASVSVDGIRNPDNPPPYALSVELANFSQDGRRSYFTPIMFFGLGAGDHVLIMENRDHQFSFSVDAILVQD
jgi:hypothetical protein